MRETSTQPRGPLRIGQGAARIDVYQAPDYDRPSGVGDFYCPADDIESVEVKERAGKPADTGTITLDNYQGKYTLASSDTQIGLRDRLVFRVSLAGDAVPMGEGETGAGPFKAYEVVGDYLVTDPPEIETEGTQSSVSLEAMDFVWGVMQGRQAFYGGEGDPIAGSPDAHLDRILAREVPEIERSRIDRIDAPTDYAAHGLPLPTVIDQLLARTAAAEGSAIAFANRREIVFKTHDTLPRPLSSGTGGDTTAPLGPQDFMGAQTSAGDGDGIVNSVRVDGGQDVKNVEQRAVTNFDHYVPVNESERLTAELFVRKSQIPAIEIWTGGDIDSDRSGLRVRVQASNESGTGPIDPGDEDSDLTSSAAREVAISDGDWTRFLMPGGTEHAVNERRPWLIVDATGEDRYLVGTDVDDTPLFRVHFSKPIIATDQDRRSIGRYGRVEKHVQDEGIATFPAARDRAAAEVARRPYPTRVFEGKAASPRAHSLRVGDVVPISYPMHRIGTQRPAEYVVTRRDVTYKGPLLRTTLELTGLDTAGTVGVTSGT